MYVKEEITSHSLLITVHHLLPGRDVSRLLLQDLHEIYTCSLCFVSDTVDYLEVFPQCLIFQEFSASFYDSKLLILTAAAEMQNNLDAQEGTLGPPLLSHAHPCCLGLKQLQAKAPPIRLCHPPTQAPLRCHWNAFPKCG